MCHLTGRIKDTIQSDTPLNDITVIDAANLYAGPLAAMILGDFGADVIKVEHPDYGDALSEFGNYPEQLSHKWVNRNKKSVPLDLHDDESQAVFKDLIKHANVLKEVFADVAGEPSTLDE